MLQNICITKKGKKKNVNFSCSRIEKIKGNMCENYK